MENASKALIIAGSVLLAILLVSLGIGIMNGSSTDSDMTEEQVTAFNGEWNNYLDTTMNGQKLKNLVQKVYESNTAETQSGEGRVISINIDGENKEVTGSTLSALKKEIKNGTSYETEGVYDDTNNGLLTQIKVTTKSKSGSGNTTP